MKKIDRAIQLGEVIGIAFGAYAVRVFLQSISQTAISPAFVTLISVALVILCAKLTKYTVAELFDRSSLLRKIVAGDSFIEGDWLDYPNGHLGILTFRYDDGKIRVHGTAINPDGKIVYSWHSVLADFDGTVLEYLFRSRRSVDGDPFNEDYGHLKVSFTRSAPRSAPAQFAGAFLHFGTNDGLIQVHGIRLSRKQAQEVRNDYATVTNYAEQLQVTVTADGQPIPSEATQNRKSHITNACTRARDPAEI